MKKCGTKSFAENVVWELCMKIKKLTLLQNGTHAIQCKMAFELSSASSRGCINGKENTMTESSKYISDGFWVSQNAYRGCSAGLVASVSCRYSNYDYACYANGQAFRESCCTSITAQLLSRGAST